MKKLRTLILLTLIFSSSCATVPDRKPEPEPEPVVVEKEEKKVELWMYPAAGVWVAFDLWWFLLLP